MAVQHIKIAKESGHGVTGAVVSGTFNMIINSPAFNNVMPSYLSYTKLGLVVKYTVFCTGYSTPAGGGSVEFHYEWGGSAWKVVTYSTAFVTGMITGISHNGYSNSASVATQIITDVDFSQSTTGVLNYAWIADICAVYTT